MESTVAPPPRLLVALAATAVALLGCNRIEVAVEAATELTASASEVVAAAARAGGAEAAPAEDTAGSPAPPPDAARVASAPSAAAEAPPEPGRPRTYYEYIDERGSVRFVASRDELPARWRDSAGTVELTSAPPSRPADRKAEFDRRRARARAALAAAEPRRAGGDEVILYYAKWCGYCRKAKAHLDGRGVDYDLRDVDQPAMAAELRSKTGSGSIPVLDVGGELVRGYDPARMDRLIAAR